MILTGTEQVVVHSLEERTRSQDLEWFRLRRFDRMATFLRQVMPNSGMRLRFIPLVSRVCRELAPQYVNRPTRTWSTARAQVGGASGLEALQAAMRSARVDQFMRTVSEKLVAQQSQILAVEPRRVPARDGGMSTAIGEITLRSFSPFEVTIYHRDLSETDIANAERVELRVPVAMTHTGATQSITYGRRVYTQAEAYTEVPGDAGTQRVPVFGASVEHGFGRIPLVAVFRESPPLGWALPPVASDLLEAAIALNLSISDVLDIASVAIPPREYLVGPGASSAAQRSKSIDVRDLTPIDTAGEANEYTHVTVNPNPPLGVYLSAIDSFLRTWCANAYVGAQSVTVGAVSSGLTGDAKAWERLEVDQERQRTATTLQDAEQDLATLAADVLRHEGVQAIPSPIVSTQYHYTVPRGNDLQSAQARVLRGRFGEIDPVAEFARSEGLDDRAQAEEVLAARLSRWSDMFGAIGGGDVPGLDATAKAL